MEPEFSLMMDLWDRVAGFRESHTGKQGQVTAARVLDWLVAWNVTTENVLREAVTTGSAKLTLDLPAFLDNGKVGGDPWSPPGDPRPAEKALERELAKAPKVPKKAVHCSEDAMTGDLTRVEPAGPTRCGLPADAFVGREDQPRLASTASQLGLVTRPVTEAVRKAAAKVVETGEEPELRETIKAQVLRGVTKALRATEAPMTSGDLMIALLEDGVTIGGGNQKSNLASHIYQTGKFQLWPEGWWFRDEPRPPRE